MRLWPFSWNKRETRSAVVTDSFMADWMSSSAGTLTGFKATIDTGYKQNPTAYGAIRLIVDNVARIPLIVYEDRGSELAEVGPKHPAQKTLDRPNATYNGVRFRQALMTDLMLAGSYYAQDTVTSVQSFQHFIYRLRPDWVTPKLNAQKTAIEAFEYSPNGSTKGILIGAEDVLHGWFIDPLDDTKGFAPIKVATASIGLANDARTWNSSLMANKGQHSNLIKVNGDMPPEEEKALRESFSAKFSGKDNAGKSIVIRNGEIDVVPLNLSPADVEWVEGVKLTLRDVATALFVPSVLLNDTENNTYSNYSAAIRIFYTMTVFPLLDMLCDDLTWFLAARFGDSIRVRYNADEVPALQPNREEKWQQVQNVDWLTINEKREFLGWGKLEDPDADKVWIPATLVPLGEEIPDFPDNTEGRGGVTRLETRAAKRPRAWLAIERMRSPLYKSVQRRLADYFRDELRELQATVLELSPATAADRLEEAVENRRDELQRLMDGLSQSISDRFARHEYEQFKGETKRAATDPWQTYISSWIAENGAQYVTHITETTRQQIREELTAGVNAGEHIRELAARLETLYLTQIIPHRSETIARTEVLSASNLGSYAGAKATGLPLKKRWLATPDARTRLTHSMANGQEVMLDEPFHVGGYELMFPGDNSRGAGAEEIVNCRCTLVYAVEG